MTTEAEVPRQDNQTRQMLQKAQGMLRQLSEDKTALESANGALQREIASLQAELQALLPLRRELASRQTELAEAKSAANALDTSLAQSRRSEQALREKLQGLVETNTQLHQDNGKLLEAARERETHYLDCKDRNRKLLSLSKNLMTTYRDQSFWSRLAEIEPVTGLGGVSEESRLQDFRIKLNGLAAAPAQAVPAPAKPTVTEEAADEDEDDER